MNYKRILTVAATLTALQFSVLAADPTAAEWAQAEKANLDKINPASLIDIIKGAPDSYTKLFAEVKPDYASSPLEITRIAALTQFLATSRNMGALNTYADALITAAKASTAGDVTCFFLDQLRWCATPQQTKEIKSFESSKQTGVADLATIAAYAAERNFNSLRVVEKQSPYAEYSAQLSKLTGSQKLKALQSGFASEDIKIAGLAMREASQLDVQSEIAGLGGKVADGINKKRLVAGKQETMVWALKLSETSDPIRKVMLLDMLGTRGNPAASKEIAECMSDADVKIAEAAQNALIKISAEDYAQALAPMLKNLPQSHVDITRKTVLRLPADVIEKALIKEYDSFSMSGKEVAMSVLQNRKIKSGVTLALAAINGHAMESAISGYRLLQECATSKEANILVGKVLKEKSTRQRAAQAAVASAAKRDETGAYVTQLEGAYKKANSEDKLAILETVGRIGSPSLLALTEEAVKDTDKEVALAAVRALTGWADNSSIKALITVALSSTDSKQRALAKRGIETKLTAKGINKADFKKVWDEVSKSAQGDAEIKKQLDEFFSK